MKILALTNYLSARGGGIPPAILRLYESLSGKGVDIVLVASDAPDQPPKNLRVVLYKGLGPRSFAFSLDLLKILDRERPDVVHLHGLWTYGSIVSQVWKRRTGNPLVVSPHGMMDNWALRHRGLKKRIGAALFEWRNLRMTTCIHALSEGEARALNDLGFGDKVIKIPNGVDIAKVANRPISSHKIILYLGRLHPKKGIAEVIIAWSLVKKALGTMAATCQLVIAGWDDGGHEEKLRKIVRQRGLEHHVVFLGPVFGADKDNLYAKADAIILASHSEGLPMSVLEAWAFGKPVFMTEQCNLPEGFKVGAAFKVTTDPSNIADVLVDVLRNPDRLAVAGQAARALAESSFNWITISNQWHSLYESLCRNCFLDEKLRWIRSREIDESGGAIAFFAGPGGEALVSETTHRASSD
jgi:glycosyltransferase involved in cell wall biosynthesis